MKLFIMYYWDTFKGLYDKDKRKDHKKPCKGITMEY